MNNNYSSSGNGKNNAHGKKFEIWIEELYHSLGYRVERNVRIGDCQLDIIYCKPLLGRKRYVECKYLSEGKVGLEEVAKFYAVLQEIRANPKLGYVVTNQDFVDRAKSFACKKGMHLYDGKNLEELDMKRRSFFPRLFKRAPSLEEQIEKIDLRKYD